MNTMSKLQLEMAILAALKRRNMDMHSVMLSEASVADRAVQVRARAFRFAWKELQNWRKS